MKINRYPRRYQVAAVAGLGALALSFAPQEGPSLLARRLADFYLAAQPEVSYLHLDQPAYAAGETLWFKAYLLDARAHQPDSLSKVLYVDVVAPDRQILFKRTLRLENGLAAGDIVLPDTLSSGVYTVRAYTSWMRNGDEGLFFTRRVPVWQAAAPAGGSPDLPAGRRAQLAKRTARALEAASQPDVQFFPEGGDYVAGLQTTVGVKAAEASGHGLALAGVVVDDKNQEVARFQTPARGMSSFSFTPQAGQKYQARVTLPDNSTATYPLPVVRAAGWLLNVREVGNDFRVFVRYQPAPGAAAPPAPLQLLGHVRGQPVYAGQGQILPGQTFQATIAKAGLPAGVLHLTLFDGQQVAQAERRVFVPETQPLQVRLRPDKPSYGPRELVTMDVEVSTADGQPAPAELSVAVAGAGAAGLPTEGGDATTVRAHLLLTSELRGYVENPAQYFQARTPELQGALDNLLLTQGWSRFSWQQVLAGIEATVADYRFPLERSLSLSGQLVRPNGKPLPEGELTMLLGKQKNLFTTNANANGDFLFLGFPGLDTTSVLLQARGAKGSRNALVRLNEWWPRPAPAGWHPPAPLSPLVLASAPVVAYGQRSRRQQALEQEFRPDKTSGIVLRNVTVTGKRPTDDPTRALHGPADAVLRPANIPGSQSFLNVFELIRGRVAGVQVSGSGQSYSVQIRGATSIQGSNQPLFLLDGIQLMDGDALLSIPVTDIERVDVLKGASAAIYGMHGAGGVIAVFTRRGGSDQPTTTPAGVVVRRLPAYYRAREFYAPRYETSRQPDKPDPRATTLYWQPRLSVPASGRARISFYTADQAGTFRASLEGVSLAGQPATAEAALTVAGRP